MASQASSPPQLLILPEDRSSDARICTLAHPRTSKPSRYYFDPKKGIYEFTRIAAPKSVCRSWLIGRKSEYVMEKAGAEYQSREASVLKMQEEDVAGNNGTSSSNVEEGSESRPVSAGYILKGAEILVATPIDILFLLLPSFGNTTSAKGLFLSADDLFEKLSEDSRHFDQMTNHEPTRKAMEERMQAVCDSVDAGDEKMYRLNEKRLLKELLRKAENVVAMGLPPSMEERFIRNALESPIGVIKHEESSRTETNAPQAAITPSESASMESLESQEDSATLKSENSALSAETEITIPDDPSPAGGDSELYHLIRIRTALSYMLSAYVSPPLAAKVESQLASEESPVSLKPLDERLASIAKLRAEALAARSLGDFSRKRSMFEEDEAAQSRAEQKRRKEEEEKKKKAGESRSIRDLKKVDTKGMKKMSDFFGKGAAAKKK